MTPLKAPERATVCRVPPKGWRCTRAPNHLGPCAAIRDRWYDRFGRFLLTLLRDFFSDRCRRCGAYAWDRFSEHLHVCTECGTHQVLWRDEKKKEDA